jgi:AcrR family transcriptional regulator
VTSTVEPTRRGGRRDAILAAAAELFARHGYPATGIDEIGAAAGITGPGVYRHFENKGALLAEVVDRAVEQVVGNVPAVVEAAGSDWEVLEGLVRNMITSVMADRAAWAVVVREQRHLDPAAKRKLARAHRFHVEEWAHALAEARPDLSDAEIRVIVHGVLGATAPYAAREGSGVSDERTVELLQASAMAILRRTAPVPR